MKTYEFTLIVPEIDDTTVDAVYSQCSDTSIGQSHGKMYVAFDRDALSLEVALNSAVEDLHKFGITPLRVEMEVPKLDLAS